MKRWQKRRWIKEKRLWQSHRRKGKKWFFRIFSKRTKVGYRIPEMGFLFKIFRRQK